MIPKPLDQITEADLSALVTDGVAERRTLEYKEAIPDFNDANRKELLADVSSFANTNGGDLIYGVTENAGVATGVPGIQLGDPDQEKLRFDAIIRTGLSPRIRHSTATVRVIGGRHALIVRVEQSWNGPHRVTFKNDGKFWARTSNGKYELDVQELRSAFLLQSTVEERISGFRTDRIFALERNNHLIRLPGGPLLALHCLPVESFSRKTSYDLNTIDELEPMYTGDLGGGGFRVNFEGVALVGNSRRLGAPVTYTQIFRNGCVEVVRAEFLRLYDPQLPNLIPSERYERELLRYMSQCLRLLQQIGCSVPIFVGITLIGVRGMNLHGGEETINRHVLSLPEIYIEDFNARLGPLLKPVLNLVWNACGETGSPYFDADGNWQGRDEYGSPNRQ